MTPDPSNISDRLARLEAKVDQLCNFVIPMQEQLQTVLTRNAQSNERIATHLEESKRVWEKIKEVEDTINEQSKNIVRLSETIIELRQQNLASIEFINSIKKGIAMLAISALGALSWLLQKWIENGR